MSEEPSPTRAKPLLNSLATILVLALLYLVAYLVMLAPAFIVNPAGKVVPIPAYRVDHPVIEAVFAPANYLDQHLFRHQQWTRESPAPVFDLQLF